MLQSAIILASDHAAVEMRLVLEAYLKDAGYAVLDLGTDAGRSVDYPDVAAMMAQALKDRTVRCGVLLCGTGIGMSIAINRYPHIRAALVHDGYSARLCRQHNDANVLILGARTTGIEVAKDCLDIFLKTGFEGGRHARRIEKMDHSPE